ncbi:MAG: urea carboxylase-associated family protein [Proteobacteria bacterium]|jgi:urea carboxylase-associated protein 2|nr:urea carboxylase-associated family protein [Pseudomonadota bacterium]MDA1300349.1 urea carboxylase-associated family protein [Pseudomonadota bacterium]
MNEYEDTLPGGRHWSFQIRRGVQMELTDLTGDGNVAMMMYNPANPLERLNLPDTLKCQHTFRLTRGHCLYSDMGRIFCSITADDVGWHDPASGTCNSALVASRWGTSSYQDERNDYIRNGRDCFLIELAKYGLGRRDFTTNVNWFSRVSVDNEGVMALAPHNSPAGSRVALRFDMDTLVVLHTCPHPLDQTPQYPRRPIRFKLSKAPAIQDDDICLNSSAENARGFANNAIYLMGA